MGALLTGLFAAGAINAVLRRRRRRQTLAARRPSTATGIRFLNQAIGMGNRLGPGNRRHSRAACAGR